MEKAGPENPSLPFTPSAYAVTVKASSRPQSSSPLLRPLRHPPQGLRRWPAPSSRHLPPSAPEPGEQLKPPLDGRAEMLWLGSLFWGLPFLLFFHQGVEEK